MIFADVLPEIPTSVFSLLAFMVVTFLVGIGWVGRVFFSELRWAVRRLLGDEKEGGLIDAQNKAMALNAEGLREVAECVKQHDIGVSGAMTNHSDECKKSGVKINSMHSAALMACDEIEEMLNANGMECSARINRIRQELLS